MKKWIVRIIGIVVILVVVGVVVTLLMIDTIAKRGIEKGATYALDVPTKLSNVSVGYTSGQFTLSGLNVSNPQGYDTPHFLDLGDASLHVTLGSLMKDVVHVPRLTLKGIDINLQKKGNQSNYDVILNNLRRFESKDEAATPGKRFIVDEVVIEDVSVHVDLLPIGGSLSRLNLKIPEVRLKNIGSDSDRGVVLGELTGTIVKALMMAIAEKGQGIIPADMLGDLAGQLKNLEAIGSVGVKLLEGVGGAMQELGQGDVGKSLENVGKGAGDAVKGLGEGLGGLLNQKKKEQDTQD